MNGSNASVAVDHKRGRQRFETAVQIARFVVAKQYAIVDFSSFDERRDRFPAIVVHRDSEDFEAAVFVLTLKFREPRDLDYAGAAPSGPEIEHHHFAPIVGQMNHLAVRILQSEIGRVPALAVFLDDRAGRRRSGRRAGDDTENRGDADDGNQAQMGFEASHQI
jgi:hypothetical protein